MEQLTDRLKLPPQSLEAEESLLGGLLIDNRHWEDIQELVVAEDFYSRRHQIVYAAIQGLRCANEPADVVTASNWLSAAGQLEAAGGLAYIGGLASNTPSTANLPAYAQIVRERAQLRRLINAATDIIEDCYEPAGRGLREVMDIAEKAVFAITQQEHKSRSSFSSFQSLMSAAIDRIEELCELDDPITGMSTGFPDLDNLTAGLQRGDLVVVAGRPSMGKTALAVNIAEHIAIEQGKAVAIFSMEMGAQQLVFRTLASLGRVNAQRLRTGRLREEDWPRIMSAVELLRERPFFIDDTPALTPLEVRSRARNLARSDAASDLGLIVVDYLQLMQAGGSVENRATEVSNITRALKSLAKELNVPVMALSQLNRGLEQRPNKRPVMSDLRESGAIEQDADLILFIYRDEVYNDDSPAKGVAEIIIGKQRNGPIGTVKLTFLGEYTRFENWSAGGDFGAGLA